MLPSFEPHIFSTLLRCRWNYFLETIDILASPWRLRLVPDLHCFTCFMSVQVMLEELSLGFSPRSLHAMGISCSSCYFQSCRPTLTTSCLNHFCLAWYSDVVVSFGSNLKAGRSLRKRRWVCDRLIFKVWTCSAIQNRLVWNSWTRPHILLNFSSYLIPSFHRWLSFHLYMCGKHSTSKCRRCGRNSRLGSRLWEGIYMLPLLYRNQASRVESLVDSIPHPRILLMTLSSPRRD